MKRNDTEKYTISPGEFRKMSTEERILEMAKGFAPPPGKPENQVLEAIFDNEGKTNEAKTIGINRFFKAAAVFLMLIGAYTVTTVFSKDIASTKFAEQTEIKLPDGTNVVLNAGSRISWSDKNFIKSRELKLKGEAYFDVEKGNKFLIKTKNGTVEILGTQLNVFSRKNEFRVSCVSGKVKVASGGEEQVILPGETAELTLNGLSKDKKSNINHAISWQQGVFYFEDKPLVSIFDALERQFDVSVNFEGNKNRSITVAFSNKSLQEALDVVCIPMGLKYEINNKKVKISEKTE